MTGVILTVGNGLMGDDGAGPLLAEYLAREPVIGWTGIDGGSMPENELYFIRSLAPRRLVIVDAADMGLDPGTVRRIPVHAIISPVFTTTHAMPLTFLLEYLREFIPDVLMLGIQPRLVAFAMPLSAEVRAAVENVYLNLQKGFDFTIYEEVASAAS